MGNVVDESEYDFWSDGPSSDGSSGEGASVGSSTPTPEEPNLFDAPVEDTDSAPQSPAEGSEDSPSKDPVDKAMTKISERGSKLKETLKGMNIKDAPVNESPMRLGARMRQKIMANADQLIDTTIGLALTGDKNMLKICLKYILPAETGTGSGKLRLPEGGISLEKMPELAASLLTQVSQGEISGQTAKDLAEVMGLFIQSHEMVEAEARMERLEAITKEVEAKRKSGQIIRLSDRFYDRESEGYR